MVHKNRHLGSDQRFSSHSNLLCCLSPPATRRNLLSHTTLSHPWQQVEQACGQSHHHIEQCPAQYPGNNTALTSTVTTMNTHNCSPLPPNEAGVKDSMGYSCPNAPSLSAVWPAHHLKIEFLLSQILGFILQTLNFLPSCSAQTQSGGISY